MLSNLFTLLRADFLKQSGLNALRYEKDRKKKRRVIGMAIVIAFLCIMIIGYSFAIAFGFGCMGMAEIIPGFALTITSLITLFFTFFKTNGVMFASHDYNMLMALPIRINTVITAKFLTMYLSNLLFAILVMVPMETGYSFWGQITVTGVIMWFFAILITPLLPMTIAAIIGMGIAAIGSGFRHKVLVQVLLSVLIIVVVFSMSFWLPGKAGNDEAAFLNAISDLGRNISDGIHKVYPLSAWFDNAINNNNIIYFLLFLGVSVSVYIIFVLVCGKLYRKINTALMSHHGSSNYKVGELKVTSLMMSLVKKEAKRFFSSVLYVTNYGVGIIFILLIAIACPIIGIDSLFDTLGIAQITEVTSGIKFAVPFGIAMIVNMSCTTAVSLSLEGKSLWIIQSLPIEKCTILKAKMLFNIILVLPASLICSIVMMFCLKVNLLQALLYIVVSVVTVSFSTVFGMRINLSFPNYDWENETEVIKQGATTAAAIFSDMIGYTIITVASFALSLFVPGELVMLFFSVLLGVAAFIIYRSFKNARISR